jgi:thymidylate kinase
MKIAFFGTHGTGKTTLAHELVASLKKKGFSAEFLGEVVRECPFPINENSTPKNAEWLAYTQYAREIVLSSRSEVLVCDRSVIDAYIYHLNRFDINPLLEEFVVEKAREYKYLFRVPIRQEYLQFDGVRSVDPEFQREIDLGFDRFLASKKIGYLPYKDLNTTINIIENGRARTIQEAHGV